MQASTAQVVDLQAYRRSRAAASRSESGQPVPTALAQVPVVWYPMWMLVPVVMVPR